MLPRSVPRHDTLDRRGDILSWRTADPGPGSVGGTLRRMETLARHLLVGLEEVQEVQPRKCRIRIDFVLSGPEDGYATSKFIVCNEEVTMPLYDYQCKECGTTFTKQESFDQHERRRNVKCPECGARKTRKLMSNAYVQTAKKS